MRQGQRARTGSCHNADKDMPKQATLSDQETADVIAYLKATFK